jgi:hypothetical protein
MMLLQLSPEDHEALDITLAEMLEAHEGDVIAVAKTALACAALAAAGQSQGFHRHPPATRKTPYKSRERPNLSARQPHQAL